MNKENFTQYLQNITNLNSDSLPEIKSLVEEYPFFQAAWVVYLKILFATQDIKYDSTLKKATAFISDRRILQSILNGTYSFKNNVCNKDVKPLIEENSCLPEKEKVVVEDITDTNTSEIVVENITEQEKELTIEEKSVSEIKQQPSSEEIKALLERQLLDLGIKSTITFVNGSANIEFENFSFEKAKEPIYEQSSEYKIEKNVVSNEEILVEPTQSRKRKMNLIDDFLKSEAKIVPDRNYQSNKDLTTDSLLEDEELFSEKLANIYIKQQHYEKALTTYEKLYLKYPEKSIYFATKIEYVKHLINNK